MRQRVVTFYHLFDHLGGDFPITHYVFLNELILDQIIDGLELNENKDKHFLNREIIETPASYWLVDLLTTLPKKK